MPPDSPDLATWACRQAERLPLADVRQLAQACTLGAPGVRALRAVAASVILRTACDELVSRLAQASPEHLAGLLLGAAHAVDRARKRQSVSVVWTGPESGVTSSRLTAAAVIELIDTARTEILLVSYATQTEPAISAALAAAVGRGVSVTLLAERHLDNPSYSATAVPFPSLRALRLHWPAASRPRGASLHAKVIVIDDQVALVGSANLTSRAMEHNLECGILLRGGPHPRAIRDHITSLYAAGELRRLLDHANDCEKGCVMGFQTPLYELSDYLKRTTNGQIQLPDFQREFKWDDDRIRALLVTVLRGHPLGIVMLLRTGNDQIRFKPRPIEGVEVPRDVVPASLLLDGQQRLTSLTQALTGTGVVATKDSRGKLLDRRYYVHMETALLGEDRIDEAVISVPGDGVVRSNFGRDIELDLSDEVKERNQGYFPLRLLYDPLHAAMWLAQLPDPGLMARFMAGVLQQAATYNIPAIELDNATSKAAVATVFEKVNRGGLELNVFELLTATFAGDKAYYDAHGTDFRLNDDWQETASKFAAHPVLGAVENTDFLQAVTLLATRKRNLADTSAKPPAVSAKREDVLRLSLNDYLEWVGPLREAFIWASEYLADQHIFDVRSIPYPKQLVPLAALRVVLGHDTDVYGVKEKLTQWFWCGVLGELYGAAIETRFVRDLEQVPGWAQGQADAVTPRTVQDASFVESRLHSLRTRNAAAYKGIYALLLGGGARDWRFDKALDRTQYSALAVDIHHVFPQKWCRDNDIDDEHRESIVNKTPLAARTNRIIGGVAPAAYLLVLEKDAKLSGTALDDILRTHLVDPDALRSTDFDAYFNRRRDALVRLVEKAMGKAVQRDIQEGHPQETADQFDASDAAVVPDQEPDDAFAPTE